MQHFKLKPSISTKILYITNFTSKLLNFFVLCIYIMALPVMEFQVQGYKIRNIFA